MFRTNTATSKVEPVKIGFKGGKGQAQVKRGTSDTVKEGKSSKVLTPTSLRKDDSFPSFVSPTKEEPESFPVFTTTDQESPAKHRPTRKQIVDQAYSEVRITVVAEPSDSSDPSDSDTPTGENLRSFGSDAFQRSTSMDDRQADNYGDQRAFLSMKLEDNQRRPSLPSELEDDPSDQHGEKKQKKRQIFSMMKSPRAKHAGPGSDAHLLTPRSGGALTPGPSSDSATTPVNANLLSSIKSLRSPRPSIVEGAPHDAEESSGSTANTPKNRLVGNLPKLPQMGGAKAEKVKPMPTWSSPDGVAEGSPPEDEPKDAKPKKKKKTGFKGTAKKVQKGPSVAPLM